MQYLTKFCVALAVAVLGLPWPATVILRGVAMGVDSLMTRLVAGAKEAKDSGAKAGMLLLSGLLVLSGLWPAALLLAFVTIWHERLIVKLFVVGLNIEDTRIHNTQGQPGPPPDKSGRVYQLQPAKKVADKDTLLSAPQALNASRKCGWEPIEMGFEWSVQHQCWHNNEECLDLTGVRVGWVKDNKITA